MRIMSPAFNDGDTIPAIYGCEGENINPELLLIDVPESAKSLALIMDDPDAPGGTFTHWLLWNIHPGAKVINEGLKAPDTVCEGKNGLGKSGYTGPCPPKGHGLHHYHFRLYALNSEIELKSDAPREELEKEIAVRKIAAAELVGTFERPAA